MQQSVAMNRFKKNLKAAMADKGISQADLAEVLGVKPSAVSKMFTTDEGITIERAERLAAAVGLPLHELFSEKGYREALTA